MAFTEFDGELDDETGFKPFDGELDAPAPTAKPEPGLIDRYRGQFEQAKKMMAPAPATSVLDRASRAPAADPMLRPEFIEEQRAIYGKMPEANRLPVLKRMATRDDVQGRAAKVLLAEAESVNATGRQAERDMPEFSRVIAEGPRVAPPAGTGLRKPRPVSFPDAQPDITEIGAMPTEAQTLARRGAGGVLAAAAADPATLAERARVDATDWNQVEFARENPVIAGAGTGGARALGGIINAPGTAAQFLAETLLNPISRRLGGDGFERVPNAPLVDGLMQAAQEWSSPQMTQEPMEAWDRDQFGTWLAANVAAQAPMFAQQVVAFMVPAARAMILPGMGAQVAGGEYAGGDSAVAAVGKGAAEAGSELISLGVMDKARSFFLKLPPGQRAAAVKDLAKRVGAASAAVAGSAAGEGGTEVLSQLGQNAIDQLAGKDTPLTSGLLASAIVGAVAGGGMMVPAAMMDLRRSSTDGSQMSVEDALITALETGQTRPAPPVIRVEDMPTTPLTPEQVAAIAPQPQVEPIQTGEVTELPGLPTDDGERIPTGQATELAGPRATTPADLGVSSVPQGSLAAMAEQQLRARFVQPVVPADAPLAAPAADAGRDQPGRSGGALGRMADDGGAGSVLPGEPVPTGRGAANQPAAVGATPGGLNAAAPAIPAAGMSESQGNTKPPGAAAPRLQNRDRSDAAYIQQMQAIGKNPDPDRLGVDRNMATGAPIVLADAVPAAQLGRVDRVVTAAGRKFPVQYAVVEAADLLPSNSADGTANAGYAEGLPGRARVVAGNGRAAGLQLAFTNGNAAGYVQGITADAGDHGVNPATLAAMKQPVLVRIMQPADVTANIGDESNVSGVADKSAKEAARDDARRLDLGTLDFNDDGTLTSAALDAFVAAMPPSEQTALRDSDGAPTKQAQDRLMAAVFQTAYDDDALLALYAQAIDPEARVVMAGLAAAAPQMMMLKGAGILDIRALVSDAAQQAINARRRGIKLADMAAQSDLDRDAGVSAVLGMFARNSRSAKRIGEELRAVAQFAYDEANKPDEDIFGPVPRASRADVLERLNDARSPQSLENARRGSAPESDVQGRPAAAAGPGNDGAVQADRPAQDAQAEDLAEAPTAEPFTTNGQALVYAAQNGIAGKVKSVEVTGGWALVPKERAPSVLTAEADAKALEAANTALAKSKWRTPAGKPWKLKPAKNVPPIFKTVAAIIDAAFGVRVQAVNGAPGNGLQFRRGAFVDTARVTSPETLIGVTGHEVKHWFDANDKATGAKLDQAIEQHLKAGAVQAQMARENAQLVAGEAPMTEAGARLELLSDINGALWVDPDFWGRLYDIDSSAFRKVLYQFMRAATKFIKVAQGSTFDLTAYVDNVAAVRDAAAQAMVERAENRRGKAGPQMLVKNARRGRPSPLDQDLFAENAAAAPVAERPSPRDRDLGDGGVATTQAGGGTAPRTFPADADAEETAFRTGDFKKMLALRKERQARDLAAVGDLSGGGVLRHEGGKRYVMVLPDVDGDGKWRIQRFDAGGFSGHMVYDGQAQATEAAIGEGFKIRDDEAIDRLSSTPEWDRGMFLANQMQQLNSKQITFDELSRRVKEYDEARTALQAPASAPTPAQADGFNLTAPTRGDVLAQQQTRTDEAKAEAARRRARDEADRKDRERRDIADRARQDASAENFMLGQDADEALAGQGGLFNSRAGEWRLFPDTMGGKGIPRADMPQVKVAKRPALFKFLADQGITFERDTVPAGSLKPTQAEYSTAKTESAKGIPSTSDDQLVLLSSDGYVLDGHHRWLAKVELGQDVEALRFNAPIDDLMNAVWQSPDVVVNSDSAGVLVQGKETLPPPPARREKINIAADTAREYIYAAEVDQAVALLEKFPDVPKADVPEADYARLAAMFTPEIERAKAVNDQFVSDLTAVADGLGAEVRTAPVKSLNRTVEKMYADEIDKGGKQAQPDWVRDLVRGTIVAENETAVPAALEALGKAMKIVRVKDRFAAPLATGYADILVNVELPNGMKGEVQIHTPPMLAAKDLGHMLYEVARALKPGADTTRLRMAQEKLYGAARALGRSESTSAAKASSETTSPSATTRPQGMSRPLITATQAPGLGSMTTGMPSTSTSLEPGGRFLQSNIGDSNAGPTSPAILPPGAEYARLADPFAENYARLEGRKVSFDVRIEDTGQTATFTVDAAQYLRELDQRRDVARRLADCVAR